MSKMKGKHHSTPVCSIHDFPYNTRNKKSLLQAAATIRERLMCRHVVAKVQLLLKGGCYTRCYGMYNLFFNTFNTKMWMLKNRARSMVFSGDSSYNNIYFLITLPLCTGAIAAGVPDLGLVIALVGAFGSSMLAMSFPPLLYCLVFWEDMHLIYIVRNFVLSFIGVIGMIVGTYATIVELIKSFEPATTSPTSLPATPPFTFIG